MKKFSLSLSLLLRIKSRKPPVDRVIEGERQNVWRIVRGERRQISATVGGEESERALWFLEEGMVPIELLLFRDFLRTRLILHCHLKSRETAEETISRHLLMEVQQGLWCSTETSLEGLFAIKTENLNGNKGKKLVPLIGQSFDPYLPSFPTPENIFQPCVDCRVDSEAIKPLWLLIDGGRESQLEGTFSCLLSITPSY